jgi:hypothetical protein
MAPYSQRVSPHRTQKQDTAVRASTKKQLGMAGLRRVDFLMNVADDGSFC